jgi:Spy/CpxP family protein refolding chaperone
MKLKVLVGFLGFLIVLNLATIGTFLYVHFTKPPTPAAFAPPDAAPRGGPMGERPWFRGLPPEQRRELVALLEEFQQETSEERTKLRTLEGDVFRLMQNDSIPAARVDSLLEEISHVRLGISRAAIHKLVKAKTVLTPEEQRMFFDAILQARPALFRDRVPPRGERAFGRRVRRSPLDSL